MATLTVLRTNVSGILGIENTPAASGGDQGQIDYYLNEAVRQILLDTRCYTTSATVTVSTASADYTIDGSILMILRIYLTVGGVQYQLKQRSLDEIIDMRRNTAAVGPARYYKLSGQNLLMFFPSPAVDDVLTFYYVPVPTEMSSGANDPSTSTYGGIPTAYHRLIELYACWKMAVYSDDSTSGFGQSFKKEYLEGVGQMRRDFAKRGGDELAPIPLPSRRRGLSWQPRPDQVGA